MYLPLGRVWQIYRLFKERLRPNFLPRSELNSLCKIHFIALAEYSQAKNGVDVGVRYEPTIYRT